MYRWTRLRWEICVTREGPVSMVNADVLACMVMMHVWCYGLRGLPGEIAGKSCVRPLFLPNCVFCFVVYSLKRWWVRFSGIFGLVLLEIRAHLVIGWLLKFSCWEVAYSWGLGFGGSC